MHQPQQDCVPNKNLPTAIKIKTQDIMKIEKTEWEWYRKTPRGGKFGIVVLCKGEFSP